MQTGETLITFRCHNVGACDIGGYLYIQVHSKNRLTVTG